MTTICNTDQENPLASANARSVLHDDRTPGLNLDSLLDIAVAMHSELSDAPLRQDKKIQEFVRKCK